MRLKNQYFILRHGQTIYQTKKKKFIYPGPKQSPVPLTEKGKKQIKTAAKKLKKEKIDLIYFSDFLRTRQTAKIIAKELGLKINPARKRGFLNEVNFDKRLRDVNLGIYHGKMKEEFYRNYPRDSKKRFYQKPKGGESWREVQKRMINFLKEIDKKYKRKKILIISHGDPLWLLEEAIKGWNSEKFSKSYKLNYIQPGELRKL